MARHRDPRDVIILEQDSPSVLKWLLLGAALGAGLALLLAPASGEETRHRLVRETRRLRQAAEDALGEVQERLDAAVADDEVEGGPLAAAGRQGEGGGEGPGDERGKKGDGAPAPRRQPGGVSAARAELERRLAAARARRRDPVLEDEEPVA